MGQLVAVPNEGKRHTLLRRLWRGAHRMSSDIVPTPNTSPHVEKQSLPGSESIYETTTLGHRMLTSMRSLHFHRHSHQSQGYTAASKGTDQEQDVRDPAAVSCNIRVKAFERDEAAGSAVELPRRTADEPERSTDDKETSDDLADANQGPKDVEVDSNLDSTKEATDATVLQEKTSTRAGTACFVGMSGTDGVVAVSDSPTVVEILAYDDEYEKIQEPVTQEETLGRDTTCDTQLDAEIISLIVRVLTANAEREALLVLAAILAAEGEDKAADLKHRGS